jgi:hypothetical protein
MATIDVIAEPWRLWFPNAATSLVTSNLGSTVVSAGTPAADPRSDSYYDSYTTGTNAGNGAIVSTSGQFAYTDFDWTWEIVIYTGSSLTGLRYFLGVGAAAPTNSDTVVTRKLLFRYSTVASDGSWTPTSADNTSQNVGSAIGSIAANTRYVLTIRFVSTGTPTAYFSVNGGTEQAVTANLPGTGNNLNGQMACFNTTGGGGSARSFSFDRGQLLFGSTAR